MKTRDAELVGLVLGVVLIVMGVATSNSGIWILGGIVLAIGLWARTRRKEPPTNPDDRAGGDVTSSEDV